MIFVLISFRINLPSQFLYRVMIANLCSWEQNDNNRVREVIFFCGATKPTWWRWIILEESCVILINSSIVGSIILFWIEYVNHRFNYTYELIYFPLCEWCVLSYYTYIYIYMCVCVCVCMYVYMYVCIHLSNGALFGECISWKIFFHFS